MPQGDLMGTLVPQTGRSGTPAALAGGAPHRWLRPALALSVLAALAACGNNHNPRVATHGSYSRPSSYDPPGPPSDPWGPWVREASRRFDVPERWIREVMRQESGGRVSATSRVGAMGLMQLMPGTYAEMQSRYGLGNDPYHPYDNLMAGTAYVREMYELYGSPAFLAAYNAGPRRLEDYLWNGRGLPNETRNYVARIGPRIVDAHPSRRAPAEVYAAAEIPLNIPAGPRRMDAGTMMALREQRDAVDPGIRVAQLPAGQVVRMDPIPDGSTALGTASLAPPTPMERPVQVASLGPVVRMDPIPDGSTYDAPLPPNREAALPPPPVHAPPAPPARLGNAPRAASGPAVRYALVTPPPPPPTAAPGGRGLNLIGRASASTLPAHARPTPAVASAPAGGGWAVQVGAFGTEQQARNAASQAQNVVASMGARAVVQPVQQGRSRLYRARVIGLTPASAQSACDRLRGRGACQVLSPDAQG